MTGFSRPARGAAPASALGCALLAGLVLLVAAVLPARAEEPKPGAEPMAIFRPENRDKLMTIPDYEVLRLAFPNEFTLLVIDSREKYLATLAGEPPYRRRLRLLIGLGEGIHDASASEAVHIFFSNPSGAVALEVLAALREAGLDERTAVLQEAIALFGKEYPAENRQRSDFFARSFLRVAEGVVPDLDKPPTETDLKLKALGPRFGDKTLYIRQVEAFVRGDPDSAAELARTRAGLSDESRLDYVERLVMPAGPSGFGEPAEIMAAIEAMPKPYRLLFVLSLLRGELFNGGMHQFFFNSSGAFAPLAAAYLRELGLDASAATLDKALAMFPKDYPVSTKARRTGHFAKDWGPWDEQLDALTEGIDMGAMEKAVTDYARREGIVPR